MTTFPASHHDLLDAELATLATLGRDGVPQQTVVWFLHESDELKLSLNSSRLKTKNQPTNVYAVDMRIGQM